MYRRDLIAAEIEKLAQVLDKIMGLKVEFKLEEAKSLFEETMRNNFALDPLIVYNENHATFEKWLDEASLSPEKLDSLGEFLYYELGVSEAQNKLFATKLNMIYELLSNKHKIVHLVNMHRQNTIQQYL